MFFNMDQSLIIEIVRDVIGQFGTIEFQNKISLSMECFLNLIKIYLSILVIKVKDSYFTQKNGVCIGSKISSNLSDLFMASINRNILRTL